jgi:hypothetical protein
MSLATTTKPKGNRDYPMCDCGKPATEKIKGEWMCRRCARLANLKQPKEK